MISYRKFEAIVVSLGFCVVLASILVTVDQQAAIRDLLGQAMMAPVLFLALHFGRRTGLAAAVVAAFLYLVIHLDNDPTLSLTDGATRLLLLRAGMFGIIGIIAGELPASFKYVAARFGDDSLIDSATNLFTRGHMHTLIRRAVAEYHRYGRPFAVLILTVEPADAAADSKRLLIDAAMVVRNNVRLVDDVGRWDDRSFCLLLEHMSPASAEDVANRLGRQVQSHARAQLSISDHVIAFPENEDELLELLGGDLAPEQPAPVAAQSHQ